MSDCQLIKPDGVCAKVAEERGAVWKPDRVQKVIRFLETQCRLHDGENMGKLAKVLPHWREIISTLYGYERTTGDKAGYRWFNSGSIWIAKKAAKSTTIAFLALYGLLEEPGAKVFVLSTTVESCMEIFEAIEEAIDQNPGLKKILKLKRQAKAGYVEFKHNRAKLSVLSGSKLGKSGKNASMILFDELGELKDDTAFLNMKWAGMARKQALRLSISTCFYDREAVWWNEFSRATEILQQKKVDPHYFAYYKGVPEDIDWRNPDNWWEHLPHAGITVPKSVWLEEWVDAQCTNRGLAEFRCKMLNQTVEQIEVWISEAAWNLCYEKFDADDFPNGSVCYIGNDPAKTDLGCYQLIFEKNGLIYLLPRFFLPEAKVPYYDKKYKHTWRQWMEQGLCTITPGNEYDSLHVLEQIKADAKRWKVREIGYDAWFLTEAQMLNLSGIKTHKVPTNFDTIGETVNEFEKNVRQLKIRHNGNPIMNFNMACCRVKSDTRGRQLIDTEKSVGAWDGVSAAITGLNRYYARARREYTGFHSLR